MKLQIDTTEKVIKVEEQVNFGELVKVLNKLLPKGEWKKYKLETNTVINWNPNPVWTFPTYPILPDYGIFGMSDGVGVTTGDFNDLSGCTTYANPLFTLT